MVKRSLISFNCFSEFTNYRLLASLDSIICMYILAKFIFILSCFCYVILADSKIKIHIMAFDLGLTICMLESPKVDKAKCRK